LSKHNQSVVSPRVASPSPAQTSPPASEGDGHGDRLARQANVPLMIGDSEPPGGLTLTRAMLRLLAPGDIVTHVYTGLPGGNIGRERSSAARSAGSSATRGHPRLRAWRPESQFWGRSSCSKGATSVGMAAGTPLNVARCPNVRRTLHRFDCNQEREVRGPLISFDVWASLAMTSMAMSSSRAFECALRIRW
jgi:hypothetical protein